MPRAKKETVKKAFARKPKLCGHENLHYAGEGKLTCILPPGHEGNHRADKDSEGVSVSGGEWSSAAGR